MKKHIKIYRPLLSLLMCLAIAVCLVPLMTLSGSADNVAVSEVSDIKYYDTGCLKSIKVTTTYTELVPLAQAYGRFAIHKGEPSSSYSSPYAWGPWPGDMSKDPTFVCLGSISGSNNNEFEWTDRNSHTMTISFDDGKVPMKGNNSYNLILWSKDSSKVYPETKLGTLKVADKRVTFVTPNGRTIPLDSPTAHSHHWVVTGDNTDTLTATCNGDGTCDKSPVSVSISAKSVTLPDTPYNAQITGADEFQSVTNLKVQPLADKGRAAYKFKAMGADSFTDPDLNKAQAGTYQAILYVTDDDNNTHSAFVEYTAIDPAKTAATGDTRPVEIIALGLGMFCAMAAVSFTLDRKLRR